MRTITQQIYDEIISGSGTTWYSSLEWNSALASHDRVAVHLIATNVAGTNPKLTVRMELSGDNQSWCADNGQVFEAALVSGSQYYVSFVEGPLDGAQGLGSGWGLPNARLAISMVGTNPTCRLKAFFCGRRI
jgi:hypothetical protein